MPAKKLKTIKTKDMGGVLGGSVDVETAFAFKKFFQSQGSFKIMSELEKVELIQTS